MNDGEDGIIMCRRDFLIHSLESLEMGAVSVEDLERMNVRGP